MGKEMSSLRVAAVAAFFCALVSHISAVVASGGVIVFVDNQQGSYLRPGSPNVGKAWTPSTVGIFTAVLLGVPPRTAVDAQVSAELNELLLPHLFNRPQHVVSLLIAGNSAERAADSAFSSSSVQKRFLATPLRERAQTPSERTMAASMLVHEMAMLPLNAGKEVEVFSLGCSAECDAECIDLQLEKLAEMEGLDFSMDATEDAAMGTFTFQGEVFDLTKRAERAVAAEAACLLHRLSTIASPSPLKVDGEKRSLFTGLLTSPQEMEEAHGVQSSKAAAASALLLKVVSEALKAGQEAYSGRLVGSIALIGTLPSSSLESLSTAVEAARSVRLLAQASDTSETGDTGLLLINVVTMFTIGLILLITLGLATCALCCMPITRETLLYSGVKLD